MEQTKKYSTLNPEVIHLLDQLLVSIELNENAVQKLDDQVATAKLKGLLAKKKIYLKELANVMEIDIGQYVEEQRQEIDIMLQKVINQFEDLFLRGNDIQLIAFLVSTEQMLQKLYRTLIYHCRFDDFLLMIFKSQLSESKRDMLELNKIQEEYI